jgi:hypothetical protein
MAPRPKIPDAIQAEVLVRCRRRCCVCYGLNRDETIKKGQIAHLDQDRSNNALENLVFLCFDHHDEFDSTTSQAKGLTRAEVCRYKAGLLQHYSVWESTESTTALMNFLALRIDLDAMVKAAIEAARQTVWYGERHAFDVLITDAIDYWDGDLYMPHILALDYYASWGWLTYTTEEKPDPDGGMPRIYITVDRKIVCDAVAARILELSNPRPEIHADLEHTAAIRGWKPNPEAVPKPRYKD